MPDSTKLTSEELAARIAAHLPQDKKNEVKVNSNSIEYKNWTSKSPFLKTGRQYSIKVGEIDNRHANVLISSSIFCDMAGSPDKAETVWGYEILAMFLGPLALALTLVSVLLYSPLLLWRMFSKKEARLANQELLEKISSFLQPSPQSK